MVFLLVIGRKWGEQLKPGSLFLIYLIFYGIGRVGLEFLRLDISSVLGININQVFMAGVVLTASCLLVLRQKKQE